MSLVNTVIELQHAWWGADASRVYFIDLARGCRSCRLCEPDVATGAVPMILESRIETYLELNPATWAQPNVRILGGGTEVNWFSERDGWGHLYLHDGRTGELVRQITSGEWLVRDVVAVDAARRDLYITVAGRVPGRNPYYREIARVNLDSGELTVLSSSDADHKLRSSRELDDAVLGEDTERLSGVSPSGEYLVETVTRADGTDSEERTYRPHPGSARRRPLCSHRRDKKASGGKRPRMD